MFFFYLETDLFLPIIREKISQMCLELPGLATDESLSNFVRSCSDVESQDVST